MRILYLLAACILITLQSYALKKDPAYRDARRNGAIAKIELKIVNDDGAPVPFADVEVFMGMNFRPKGYLITGRTDTNGVFVVKGKTCGDEVVVNISKAGFYHTTKIFKFAEMGHEHEVSDGCWQPYGKREVVTLREIRNPIELPHENFWKFKYTKALNTWLGYDIKENDFVAPNGGGKVSDFEVYINWNGEWIPKYTGMSVKIRFVESFAGYYAYEINRDSVFKGPYSAMPSSVYLTKADFYEKVLDNGERREQKDFNPLECWVVRSRCKTSPEGRLIEANYAVIYSIAFTCKRGGYGGFCITGSFNPTPNDTNLEDIDTVKRSELLWNR